VLDESPARLFLFFAYVKIIVGISISFLHGKDFGAVCRSRIRGRISGRIVFDFPRNMLEVNLKWNRL
jgi:hypothetical protein